MGLEKIMLFYLIVLCIGQTSPSPILVKFNTLDLCLAEASKVRKWETMLYKCEAQCIVSDYK